MKPGSRGWRPGNLSGKSKKNKIASANQKVAAAKGKGGTKVLSFPSDLGEHRMILKFYEYDYSSVVAGSAKGGTLKASIALPLPTNIIDQSRLEVGGRQIGVIGGLAADVASANVDAGKLQALASDGYSAGRAMGSLLADANFSEIKDKIVANVGAGVDIAGYLMRAGAAKISPQIGQAVGAVAANALNPQTTLIFDGVDLKIHNFEWMFSPKNAKETDQLDKIVQLIKYYIHPDYKNPLSDKNENAQFAPSFSRGLLTYPSLMEVELKGVGGGLNYVFRPGKFLMVNQFNVDYTPAAGVVLNKGGTATMMRCSMNTTESAIHTREDYRYGDLDKMNPELLGGAETVNSDQTDTADDSDGSNDDAVKAVTTETQQATAG